jgi:hypothetical protein
MLEIIEETLIDSLKILPFLFLTYLLMEYLERKTSEKTKEVVKKSGKIGPLIGSILGCFPQCGFSVSASNLYAGRVITLGTLIAIFLSTSDEMLPIAISRGASLAVILKIIGIKVLISIIAGFIIDYILRHKTKIEDEKIHDICDQEHCHCEEHGIVRSTLKHTINIFIFIVLISFILNLAVYLIGEENLSNLLMQNTVFGPIIASIIGLIPNCAASVILMELYLSSTITLGSVIAGLLTGAGVGLAVLFKVNKNVKENLKIIGIVYIIGAISGILINFIESLFI